MKQARDGEDVNQAKLFGQLMRFLGNIFGSNNRGHRMIEEGKSEDQHYTLKIEIDKLGLRFLYPVDTFQRVGKLLEDFRYTEG